MNCLLRQRIWASFLASSGLAPCDVLLGVRVPAIARLHAHLHSLVTSIHEISGLGSVGFISFICFNHSAGSILNQFNEPNGKPIMRCLATVHRLPLTVYSFLRHALCGMRYALWKKGSRRGRQQGGRFTIIDSQELMVI